MLCSARIITFQLLFEFTKCRELFDIYGNIVLVFQRRIVKAFLTYSGLFLGICRSLHFLVL